jgi:hypothetical protein
MALSSRRRFSHPLWLNAAIWMLVIAGTYAAPPVIDRYTGGTATATMVRAATLAACACAIAFAASFPKAIRARTWLIVGAVCLAGGLLTGSIYIGMLPGKSARFESARVAIGELKPVSEIQPLIDACCSIAGPTPSTDCRSGEGMLWCASGDPTKFYTRESVEASFRLLAALYVLTCTLLAAAMAACLRPLSRRAPEQEPLRLFISYSRKDEQYRTELGERLQNFERIGVVQSWHDGRITPGAEWARQIDTNLQSADVVLLLISPDYLASEYCALEYQLALKQASSRQMTVVPIIIAECDWQASAFARLQVIPRNGKPVSTWADRNTGWSQVVDGLVSIFEQRKSGM